MNRMVATFAFVILAVLLVSPALATTTCSATGYCGTDSNGGCDGALSSITYQTVTYESFDTALVVASITYNNITQMAQFYPVVDNFAVLEIANTSAFLQAHNPKVSFSIITSTGYIPLPPKLWSSGSYYVGSRGVVVTLNQGQLSNMTWDGEGCDGICDSATCVDGTCGIHFPVVGANSTGCGEKCNIKVYIVWAGTDSKNRTLTSGNYAFSAMQKWWIFDPWKLLVIAAEIFSNFGNSGFNDLLIIKKD